MRDPKRIDKVLAELKKVWSKYPDWRFMQLICNLPFESDPFHMEDEQFIEFLKKSDTDELF